VAVASFPTFRNCPSLLLQQSLSDGQKASQNDNERLHAESNVVVGGSDLSELAFVMADTTVGCRRLCEAHDFIAAGVKCYKEARQEGVGVRSTAGSEALATAQSGLATVPKLG